MVSGGVPRHPEVLGGCLNGVQSPGGAEEGLPGLCGSLSLSSDDLIDQHQQYLYKRLMAIRSDSKIRSGSPIGAENMSLF